MVDPVTIGELVASALTMVGSEVLKGTASKAVKDAYEALKGKIANWAALDPEKINEQHVLSRPIQTEIAEAVDARSPVDQLEIRKLVEQILIEYGTVPNGMQIAPLKTMEVKIENIHPAIGNVVGASIGDSVIVTGSKSISIGHTVAGRDFVLQQHQDNREITSEQAFERIASAVKLNLTQIQSNIEHARADSSQFFRLTLIFASLGFIIVMFGVALLYINQISAGIAAAVSGSIPEVTAAIFFKKDQELRKTIDEYHIHMLQSQKLLTMIDVAETIRNPTDQDKMKQEIIFSTLGIDR
jgi:hypothetical protein